MTRTRMWVGISLVVTAAVAGWIAFLFLLAASGGPVAPAPPQEGPHCAGALRAAVGKGRADSGSFELAELDATGAALLVCAVEPVPAGGLPILELAASRFPPNYVLMLAWRTSERDEAQFTRLQVPRGRIQSYFLANVEGWDGSIIELALYLYPQEPAGVKWRLEEPVRLDRLRLLPDGLVPRIHAMGTSWFAVDPWNHRSPNTLGKHLGLLGLYRLNPALIVLWALGVIGFGWLFRARGLATVVGAAFTWALAPAALSYVHWLDSLRWQHDASRRIFGNLDAEQRQLRQYDGDLVALARSVVEHLQGDHARQIQVFGPDRLTELRTTYHLRPLNVHSTVLAPEALRPGNFILVIDDPDALAMAKSGFWLGPDGPLPIAVRVASPRGALLEILK